jgi:hypothetical protein
VQEVSFELSLAWQKQAKSNFFPILSYTIKIIVIKHQSELYRSVQPDDKAGEADVENYKKIHLQEATEKRRD